MQASLLTNLNKLFSFMEGTLSQDGHLGSYECRFKLKFCQLTTLRFWERSSLLSLSFHLFQRRKRQKQNKDITCKRVEQIKLDDTWKTKPSSTAQKAVTVIIHSFSKVLVHFRKTVCLGPFKILLNKYWNCSGKLARLSARGFPTK